MDRTLTLDYPAAIPVGHRVEVTELAGTLAVTDLDTGIGYAPAGESDERTIRWTGVVLACTVVPGEEGTRTALVVGEAPPAEPGEAERVRAAAEEALEALSGADAALAAAKAEALRWSSTPSNLPPPRP